jgi:solute:Na+ symporter, SSS family
VVVTFATPPEPAATLEAFYRKVRPAGGGWEPVARATEIVPPPGEIGRSFWFWLLGITAVYSIMFATGGVIFHLHRQAVLFGSLLIVSGLLLVRGLLRERQKE